jgi:hypothetical protein
MPDIRCLLDPAGYAGYPAKGKIRPDNPALPDIRSNPSNFFTFPTI